VYAQIFEDAFDLKDKAYVEGSGVLEYILYNLDNWWTEQDDPFDIFLDAYIRRLEKGQITTLGGEYVQYVVDYNSFYWVEDNAALSINVKRMMARHRYNVSLTHYQNQDGSTTFAINYLNAGGKYEFFAFMAYKQ
jgi:hypothetical protein